MLGCDAVFGSKNNDGLQESAWASCPCGKGRDGREKPTIQLHTCLEGKVIEEIRDFIEWGGWNFCRDNQTGCCGCGSHGCDIRCCFLLGLPRSPLRGCCFLSSGF